MGVLIIAGVCILVIWSVVLGCSGACKTSPPPHFTSPSCEGRAGVQDADGWWIVPLDHIEGWNEMTDVEKLAHVQSECGRSNAR